LHTTEDQRLPSFAHSRTHAKSGNG
jgi:hypothetical protein